MDILTVVKAIEIVAELTLALVNAAQRGATTQEALIEARDVLTAKIQIDSDVDAAARGTARGAEK